MEGLKRNGRENVEEREETDQIIYRAGSGPRHPLNQTGMYSVFELPGPSRSAALCATGWHERAGVPLMECFRAVGVYPRLYKAVIPRGVAYSYIYKSRFGMILVIF